METQSVHTSVQFYVYGPVGYSFLACSQSQGTEQAERIYFRFKVIVKHGLECRHLWIHYHDVGCYAGLTQGYTLIGHCHCEIIHTVILQGFGCFYGTRAVAVGLYHAHEFSFWLHL